MRVTTLDWHAGVQTPQLQMKQTDSVIHLYPYPTKENPNKSYPYSIDRARVQTWKDAAHWMDHLTEKIWMDTDDIHCLYHLFQNWLKNA